MYLPNISDFPKFSLKRLLSTCFGNNVSENNNDRKKICILIDLPDLSLMHGHKFLQQPDFSVQKYAHNVFLKDLIDGVSESLSYTGNAFFAFKTCLLYTSPSPRDLSTSRMPSSA